MASIRRAITASRRPACSKISRQASVVALSHKIRASNHRNPSASPSTLAKKILPIVSRGQNHPPMPLGRSLAELNLKGIYHRLDTHGLHNTGGP